MGLVISLDGNCLDLRQLNKYVSYRRILRAFHIISKVVIGETSLKCACDHRCITPLIGVVRAITDISRDKCRQLYRTKSKNNVVTRVLSAFQIDSRTLIG